MPLHVPSGKVISGVEFDFATHLTLVFTDADHWSTVRGRFVLSTPAARRASTRAAPHEETTQ